MKKKNLIIYGLSALFLLLGVVSSCTFDYFDDDSNYVVYVKEMRDYDASKTDNVINDCRVLIYNEEGKLVKQSHAVAPFNGEPWYKDGEFRFRLSEGKHSVLCYTNTTSTTFEDLDDINTAKFSANFDQTKQAYVASSTLNQDKKDRAIVYGHGIQRDTAKLVPYLGTIAVGFKFGWNASYPENTDLKVTGVGTRQILGNLPYASFVGDENDLIIGDAKKSDKIKDKNTGTAYNGYVANFFPSVAGSSIIVDFTVGSDAFSVDTQEELKSGDTIIIFITGASNFEVQIIPWGGVEAGDNDGEVIG